MSAFSLNVGNKEAEEHTSSNFLAERSGAMTSYNSFNSF